MAWSNQEIPCNKNTGSIFTSADLKKPELNILLGAMYLGLLIDDETNNDKTVNLPSVLYRYNVGYFDKKFKNVAAAQILEALPKGSEAYNNLLKLIGTNGCLDVLT